MRLISLAALLSSLFLAAACMAAPGAREGALAPADSGPAAPAPAIALPETIPAGSMVHLALPTRGAPQSDATMTMEARIVAAVTHAPVPAAVYVLADQEVREPLPAELLASHVVAFQLTLPPTMQGWLLVRANGYRDWEFRLSYHTQTSRTLVGPVALVRVVGEGM